MPGKKRPIVVVEVPVIEIPSKRVKLESARSPVLVIRPQSQDTKPESPIRCAQPLERALTAEERTLHFLSNYAGVFNAVLPEENYLSRHAVPRPQIILYTRLEQQPANIKGTLKDYQLDGLSYLAWLHQNNASGILGDEMGLGKTLQTLALFSWIKETRNIAGPHLVICPLSVLQSWEAEIAKWTPDLTVLRFHGTVHERARILSQIALHQPNIVVTSYEAFRAEHKRLKMILRWHYLVLDEGHKIKNAKTEISATLHGLGAQHRLLLTGTPLQNNLQELWSLLRWMFPLLFTDRTEQRFIAAFDMAAGAYDREFMASCQRLLQIIMLRRTKEGVSKELTVPPRDEYTLYAPLAPLQRFWYQRLLTRMDNTSFTELFGATSRLADEDEQILRDTVSRTVTEVKSGNTSTFTRLMNLLMQLRKCCNHPYSLEDGAPDPYYLGEHLVIASAKFQLLDKLLDKILKAGERVLILCVGVYPVGQTLIHHSSGFTSTLDMVEDLLRLREIKYGRLDGSTARARRSLDIRLFNKVPPLFDVFLISTRAGGLGLNLASASNVIMLDVDWNPQATKQAIARAHRIGQTKRVQVYTIIVENSVESQMLSRIQKKEYLSAKVLGSTKQNMQNSVLTAASSGSLSVSPASTPSTDADTNPVDIPKQSSSFNMQELLDILRGGSTALASTWAEDGNANASECFNNASIDEILQRSRHLQVVQDAKVERGVVGESALSTDTVLAIEDEENRFLQGREAVQTRLWEGRSHNKSKTNEDIRKDWENLEKRVRKERVVNIDGHAVSLESISTEAWTAVPTITADKDKLAKLQEPKRKRAKFEHQDFCINCWDGGTVVECRTCPRVLHPVCTGRTVLQLKRAPSYTCPQHNCFGCQRTTADCGGLLFRCQTCPAAYCDDCIDAENGDSWECLGETIKVFEDLGYGPNNQVYWIRCSDCASSFMTDNTRRVLCKNEIRQKALC